MDNADTANRNIDGKDDKDEGKENKVEDEFDSETNYDENGDNVEGQENQGEAEHRFETKDNKGCDNAEGQGCGTSDQGASSQLDHQPGHGNLYGGVVLQQESGADVDQVNVGIEQHAANSDLSDMNTTELPADATFAERLMDRWSRTGMP